VSLHPDRFSVKSAYCVYPCPCGYYGHPTKECTCSSTQILRYQKRISGPLLDRIDIHISVPSVEYEKLSSDRLGEPSARIRDRVELARSQQRKRFAGVTLTSAEMGEPARNGLPLQSNADMGPAEVRVFCELEEGGRNLIRMAMKQMNLSARAYHRVLKLARTIADLAGCERIEVPHLAEAIQYRPRGQG
jgi:magnesium chelatase family protein